MQEKLLLSACHLLVSLATTVRPVFLISIPAVQKVFNRITDTSAQRLPDKVMGLTREEWVFLRSWASLLTTGSVTTKEQKAWGEVGRSLRCAYPESQ